MRDRSWSGGGFGVVTLLFASLSSAQVLSDGFDQPILDSGKWVTLYSDGFLGTMMPAPPAGPRGCRSSQGQEASPLALELSGEVSPSQNWKRIHSIQEFGAGASASAVVMLNGDYQKFGFGEDGYLLTGCTGQECRDAGAYFDTLEPDFGGAPNTVHALVVDLVTPGQPIDPRTNTPYPLCDIQMTARWGEWNCIEVSWLADRVEFSVNGGTATCSRSLAGQPTKALGIFNARSGTMFVDSARVIP